MMVLKGSLMVVAIVTALYLVACSSTAPREARQWQPTAATDFKSVAGKWEGLLIRSPRTPDDDSVTLVIGDTGTYEFMSYRTICEFAGRGKFALIDGKLSAKTDTAALCGPDK
jgi:hypothetical protein